MAASRRAWLRREVGVTVLMLGVGVTVVAGFLVLGVVADRPFRFFSKEPAETLEAPFYVGWFAHVTALVWAAGAVSALLAAAVLRAERGAFLLACGALTMLLLADDLFLLHEGPYNRLGIPQEVVYLGYGLLAAGIALRWGRLALDAAPILLAAAILALGISAASDSIGNALFVEHAGRHLHVVEDGAKFLGALLWSTFFVRLAVRWMRAPLPEAG